MSDSDQFQNHSANTGIIQLVANVVKRVVTVAARVMTGQIRWDNLGCLLVNYLSVGDVDGSIKSQTHWIRATFISMS